MHVLIISLSLSQIISGTAGEKLRDDQIFSLQLTVPYDSTSP